MDEIKPVVTVTTVIIRGIVPNFRIIDPVIPIVVDKVLSVIILIIPELGLPVIPIISPAGEEIAEAAAETVVLQVLFLEPLDLSHEVVVPSLQLGADRLQLSVAPLQGGVLGEQLRDLRLELRVVRFQLGVHLNLKK